MIHTMIGVAFMLGLMALAFLMGRYSSPQTRTPKPKPLPKPICGCGHHLAFHGGDRRSCAENNIHGNVNDSGHLTPCRCVKYVGPEYLAPLIG